MQLPGYIVSVIGAGLALYLATGRCLIGAECLRGEMLGLPIPLYGVMFYLIISVLFTAGVRDWLRFIAVAGLMYHGYLIVRTAGQFLCLSCLFMFAITFAIALLSLGEMRQRHLGLLIPVAALVIACRIVEFAPVATELPMTVQAAAVEQACLPTEKQPGQIQPNPVKMGETQPNPVKFKPTNLRVQTEEGAEMDLDLTKKPALLFSWWCSHCGEALQWAASLPESKRPHLVAIYNEGNYVAETNAKLAAYGLKTVYYSDYKPGIVPVLLVADHGKLKIVKDYESH